MKIFRSLFTVIIVFVISWDSLLSPAFAANHLVDSSMSFVNKQIQKLDLSSRSAEVSEAIYDLSNSTHNLVDSSVISTKKHLQKIDVRSRAANVPEAMSDLSNSTHDLVDSSTLSIKKHLQKIEIDQAITKVYSLADLSKEQLQQLKVRLNSVDLPDISDSFWEGFFNTIGSAVGSVAVCYAASSVIAPIAPPVAIYAVPLCSTVGLSGSEIVAPALIIGRSSPAIIQGVSALAKPNRFATHNDQQELTVIVLDEDVAQVFTSSESVNKVLRVLAQTMPN